MHQQFGRFQGKGLLDHSTGSSRLHETARMWETGEQGLKNEKEYHNIVHTGVRDGIATE